MWLCEKGALVTHLCGFGLTRDGVTYRDWGAQGISVEMM